MVPLQHILFFDIETVPVVPFYDDLKEGLQVEWERKARNLKRAATEENATVAELFEQRAGVYSEFSKVVAIGFGAAVEKDGQWSFIYKCLAGDDEKALLNRFCESLSKFNKRINRDLILAGHNIKEFDIPFLARRMLINGMSLPQCLQLHNKKPWEIPHIDTMELWKFGDFKAYTSLNLLAAVFDIPSPKSDINGAQVAEVYYKEKDLSRIADYCARDVWTTAQVYLRLTGDNRTMLIQNLQPSEINQELTAPALSAEFNP